MKVTVIGGSGFLGSHVADRLSEEGHEVRIFDRVVSPWIRQDQEMIVGDLLDTDILENVIAGSEIVYHFAALSDLNDALDKPMETVKVNILGTVSVLEACRKFGVQRVIYASTVYVYSREGGFYRCSKQAAEHYVEEYSRAFGQDYTILRYGSLYGPRSDQSNGLYRVIREAIQKGVVRYVGSPEATREYIHVEDAAKASVVALGGDFRNQSIIFTGHQSMSVADLMKMLAEILGFTNPVEFIEGDNFGHYVRTPYAYQPKLGRKYTPDLHVDLGQGLLQMIDQISNNINTSLKK